MGISAPINPFRSTPIPMDAHIASAQRPGRGSVWSVARSRLHSAAVIASVSMASGISTRVNRNSPTLAVSASPE